MWPFQFRKRKVRQEALDQACRLLGKQIQAAAGVEDFFKKSQNLWSLGYCFGMLQASIEAADPKAKLTDHDLQKHIGTGLGRVYANEVFGVLFYRVGLSSMGIDQFYEGRIAGATEYVQVLNTKSDQVQGLLRYLRAAKVEVSPLRV